MRLTAFLCLLWSSIALAAIVGIDLGHQFSKAIMVAPGLSFEIVVTDEGKRKDLSAISLRPHVENGELIDADRVFGAKIGSLCSRFPESCAANIKALLGKQIDDSTVKEYLERHHGVSLTSDKLRNNSVSMQLGSDTNKFDFPVEELMAMTLNELKDRVLNELKNHRQAKKIAEDVAISIAPYASQAVRRAYLDALHLANYSTVLGLVDEGTAVARSYIGSRKLNDEDVYGETVNHIIYDSGAGSTTATLFSYTYHENQTMVLDIQSVGHEESFGGELLTQSVYQLLFERYLKQFKLPKKHTLSPKLASRLLEAAERAKIVLSANNDYKVTLENFPDDKDFSTVITRDEFEEANVKSKSKIGDPINEALKNCPTGPKTIDDIKSVILTGGSSRVPFVQKELIILLGSEDKIAKTVNADEACALGTTFRAYELKMITSNPYNVFLTDRIFSDFDVSIDGAQDPLFPKGSASGATVKKSLGAPDKKLKSVGLLENGALFKTYSIENTANKAANFKCESPEVFATFKIDQNKIIALSALTLECSDPEPETVEEGTSTALNTTASKKAKGPTKVKLAIPDAEFSSLKPLLKDHRQTGSNRLAHLKQKDFEKNEISEIKNLAESTCYELRSYLEEHGENIINELGAEKVESLEKSISDTLEWLDYESDHATLDELKQKYQSITIYKAEAEDTVNMLTSDLSIESLQKLHQEGLEISSLVQEYLLEYGSQIQEVRGKYEKAGFDFDPENDKIMKKLYGTGTSEGTKLDKHFKQFKEALKALSNTLGLSDSAYMKRSKKEIFAEAEAVRNLIVKMVNDVMPLQLNHEKRLEYLLSRLNTLKKRELKEAKKKAKEAEKAALADESAETEAVEADPVEQAEPVEPSEPVETVESKAPKEKTEEVHDEL